MCTFFFIMFSLLLLLGKAPDGFSSDWVKHLSSAHSLTSLSLFLFQLRREVRDALVSLDYIVISSAHLENRNHPLFWMSPLKYPVTESSINTHIFLDKKVQFWGKLSVAWLCIANNSNVPHMSRASGLQNEDEKLRWFWETPLYFLLNSEFISFFVARQ